MKYILGLDPGFAHLGMALYDPVGRKVDRWEVVTTEKSSNKTLLAREDNVDRFRLWHAGFTRFVAPNLADIRAVCSEGMSQPRAAGAAAKLFMSWGGLLFWCMERNLPFFQISPQELKKFLVGKKDASKDEVINAIHKLDPGMTWPNKTLREHVADAAGAAIALVNRVPELQLIAQGP